MLKSKKLLQINVALLVMLCIVALILPLAGNKAQAETLSETQSDQPDTRGIFTKLTLTLDSAGDGYITASVRNDFTLGYSTIQVVVEIYASNEFCENYQDMVRMARKTTLDLDIYDTLSVTCAVGGQPRYWCALMKYKQDQKDWETKVTSLVYLDGMGNKLG